MPNPTHVYILGFSDGLVKVGRTSNPKLRIRQHATKARHRGAVVTGQWVRSSDQPVQDEWWLRFLGGFHLARVEGFDELFAGEFDSFVALIEARPEFAERWAA